MVRNQAFVVWKDLNNIIFCSEINFLVFIPKSL